MNFINHITPFTRFTEEQLKLLSEEEIIIGFKVKNPQITQMHFYGNCQKAYLKWNKKYQFVGKENMDFYTLSNDYYYRLAKNNWKELEVERQTAKLVTWIIGGFLFTTLDALKQYNQEQDKRFYSLPIEVYSEKISNLADNTDDIDLREIRDVILKDSIDKKIFDKYYIQGYKTKEIAEELDITPSAVSQRNKNMINVITKHFNRNNYGKK